MKTIRVVHHYTDDCRPFQPGKVYKAERQPSGQIKVVSDETGDSLTIWPEGCAFLKDRPWTILESPDVELTPDELEAKYSPEGDGEHSEFTLLAWITAVFEEETILGYWVWVHHKLTEEI